MGKVNTFDKKLKSGRKIKIKELPIDTIDEYIINKISDHDITTKFGKPQERFSGSYEDLDAFRKEVYDGVKIDINKNIKAQKNKLPEGVKESLQKLLPVRTEFEDVGVVIKPSILERNKIKY